jgi:hypothetical protein
MECLAVADEWFAISELRVEGWKNRAAVDAVGITWQPAGEAGSLEDCTRDGATATARRSKEALL